MNKAQMKIWVGVVAAGLAMIAGQARAVEHLIVQFSTRVPHPPPKENYAPNNVHVAWIEDGSGNFIKTIGRWANNRRNALNVWYGLAGSGDTDAVSGATQTDEGTYVTSWTLTAKGSAVPVPDGVYKIRMQVTWNDGGTPGAIADYTFDKNGTASTQTPPDQLDGRGYGYENVMIYYTGRSTSGSPDITVLPNNLDFGQQAAGSNTAKTFQIQNMGGGDLDVYDLALAGADKAAYALVSPPALPFTVAPDGKQTISVNFSPALTKTYNDARVIVTSSSPGKETTTVTLAGQGAAPRVGINVTSVTFPATAVGANVSKNFTVQNNSGVPLILNTLRTAGLERGVFSITAPTGLPVTINPWAGRAVTVKFTPTSDQSYDYVRIAVGTNDPVNRVTTVSLHAQGTRVEHGSLLPARPLGGPAGAAVYLNPYIACVGQGATLAAYNVADPAAPRRLGEVRLGGPIRRMIAYGNYVYAALGAAGLAVADVSDPARPRAVRQIAVNGTACDLALSSQTLCLAAGMGGLCLFNVTDPSAPVAAGVFATQGPARAVAAAGTLACIADAARGLRLVGIADPAHPAQIGEYRAEFGTAVQVAGSKAYLATAQRELHVISIAAPAAPARIAVAPLQGDGLDLALAASAILVAHGPAGVEMLDLGTTLPVSRGWVAVSGAAQDLALAGPTALVAAGPGGLRLLNVGGPGLPVETASASPGMTGEGVANADALGAVADGTGGLKVVDLSAYGMAKLNGALGGVEARAVALRGGMAYVAAGKGGLKVIDLANPEAPVVRGSFTTQGSACGVAVTSTTALVADGLKVYRLDITDPTSISQTGVWTSDGYAMGVAMAGAYGYVANGGAGLSVLSLPEAGGLSRVGSRTLAGVAHGVAVDGVYAYIAAGVAGMHIVNIADPPHPGVPVQYNTAGRAFGIALQGQKACIADGWAGLSVVDVSAPSTPQLLARSAVPLMARAVSFSGDRLLAGDTAGGPVYFLLVNAAGAWQGYE